MIPAYVHEIEGNMSKANSRIFLLVGLGVCLLATIPLIFGLVGSTTMTTHMANGGFQTQVTSFGNAGLFWLAIGMYVVGAITSFVGYIGALLMVFLGVMVIPPLRTFFSLTALHPIDSLFIGAAALIWNIIQRWI